MDSEKYTELQRKIIQGKSPNDEGPYYHHSWWESYKGSVKGKLGGVVIGATVGAIVGGIFALPLGIAFGVNALALIGGFAAAGSLYAAHEFSDIGKVTGAIAATQEQAEARMKTFEDGKFSEIRRDIEELKSIVKGKPVSQSAKGVAREKDDMPYRTTHYAKINAPLKNRYVFWKIAAMGLMVGMATGALLASSGLAAPLLHGLVGEGSAFAAALGGYAAPMAIFGALGASFGINRDVFRKIFDTTDLWFKGMLSHRKVREHQETLGESITNGNSHKKEPEKQLEIATTIIPETPIEYPQSSTYHRDKVLAAAEKALLNFDHTRATPQ